jgi:hypothetical protein
MATRVLAVFPPAGRGAALSDLGGRQDPHRAADTPEHTEHEDDYPGNQP